MWNLSSVFVASGSQRILTPNLLAGKNAGGVELIEAFRKKTSRIQRRLAFARAIWRD
jgi:hypothetical protein